MIKKINLSKKIEEKKDINMIESDILDSSKHISMINMILLDAKFDGKSTIIKNLKQKLNIYKSQDKKKNRFNEKTFISYDQLLEKFNSHVSVPPQTPKQSISKHELFPKQLSKKPSPPQTPHSSKILLPSTTPLQSKLTDISFI